MTDSLEELVLVLTADCNLRCSYCYQNAKGPRATSWPVLRTALDLLLSSRAPGRTLSFAGGEPALEFPTLRQAVDYVDEECRRSPPGAPAIACHLTTNGLLVGAAELALLARRDFLVDLSADGVAPAQDLRASGSFEVIDALLDRWRRDHPRHFRRRCRVAVTCTRASLPHLADSFDYLLGKQVRDVLVQARIGDEGWTAEDVTRLDAQFARICSSAAQAYAATGVVAFAGFRRDEPGPRRRVARVWGCSAPLGRALTVDVDGTVYACALAARSYQRFQDVGLERRLGCLALGDVRAPDFPRRLAALASRAGESGIFLPKASQHAGGRSCATCRYRAGCVVCPIARARQAPGGDLNAVPDHLCAFNRVVSKYRRLFRSRSGAAGAEQVLSLLFGRARLTT